MLIPRRVSQHIAEIGKYFPIISLTGPRQAGKTTLLSELYPDYRYLTFEDPEVLRQAESDPRSFLQTYGRQVIFDEVQRVPELFNYLQGEVDRDRSPARFILSGSQNFLLLKRITQSLAGRVGIVRLMPLDLAELFAADLLPENSAELIVQGSYPDHYNTGIPARFFYPNYLSTYLARDVADFVKGANLRSFGKFMKGCALYAGQTLNYEKLAVISDVTVNTVKQWLAILEASYIIFLLPPYFENFGKRLVKSPKLYFMDTGLLSHLLGIKQVEKLATSTHAGALFENLMVSERAKSLHHLGQSDQQLYYWRSSKGLECDLLESRGEELLLTEIKASATYAPKQASNLRKIAELVDRPTQLRVVYGGDRKIEDRGVSYLPWWLGGEDWV